MVTVDSESKIIDDLPLDASDEACPVLRVIIDRFVIISSLTAIAFSVICEQRADANAKFVEDREMVSKVEVSEAMNVKTPYRLVAQSVQRLRKSLDENFEFFDSDSSSIIGEIFEMMDAMEAMQELQEASDPVLEHTLAELVDNVVNNPGQIPDIIQEKITGLEVVLSNLQ